MSWNKDYPGYDKYSPKAVGQVGITEKRGKVELFVDYDTTYGHHEGWAELKLSPSEARELARQLLIHADEVERKEEK